MITVGSDDFRFRVDESWPTFPAGDSAGEAVGVACDSRDRVFVGLLAGRNPCVSSTATPLRSPPGAGVFARPHGIFIVARTMSIAPTTSTTPSASLTADGHVAANDARERAASRPTPARPSIDYRTIACGAGPFNFPDERGARRRRASLYVADGYGNARVHRFDGRRARYCGRGASREPAQGSSTCRTALRSIAKASCTWPIARTAAVQSFTTRRRVSARVDRRRPAVPGVHRPGAGNVSTWPSLGYRAGALAGRRGTAAETARPAGA